MIKESNHEAGPVLDIAAVKAFVLAAQLRSFTRAGEALGISQAAVSLKLRRLEEQLGHRLLERTPRLVRLSAEGAAFLEAARTLVVSHDLALAAFRVEPRRLVLGINHLLVGGELPSLLRRLSDLDAGLRIEMRVGATGELMQAYERGELDAALVLRPPEKRKQGKAAFAESFFWFAAPGWQPPAGRPLPLATQGDPCRIRAAAVRALERAGIAWEEVFIGKGAAILGAAVAGGMAVAALPARAAPAGAVDVAAALSLPKLPAQEVMLYSALNDRRSREALRMLTLALR